MFYSPCAFQRDITYPTTQSSIKLTGVASEAPGQALTLRKSVMQQRVKGANQQLKAWAARPAQCTRIKGSRDCRRTTQKKHFGPLMILVVFVRTFCTLQSQLIQNSNVEKWRNRVFGHRQKLQAYAYCTPRSTHNNVRGALTKWQIFLVRYKTKEHQQEFS